MSMLVCLMVCRVVGWMGICMCVKRGIGRCVIVLSAWGFSSSASSEYSGG